MAATKDPTAAPQPARPLKTGSSAPDQQVRSLERALGGQVRLLRRQHDLSVADLAGVAGISTGMLSKIENGQISPSLSTLHAISTALGVPLSSLFSAFEEHQDCSFTKAGQGVVIERRGSKVGHVYELLGHALEGDVVVEPFLIVLKTDAAPYMGFQHAGAEFIYMLEGRLLYRHGDASYELNPGDAILFDANALHGPEVLLTHPLKYLSIIVYSRERS